MSTPLLVGVDLGTTNIKALAFEPDGRIAAEASVPTPTHYPRPAWAYHDPEALWTATVHSLRRLVERLGDQANRVVSLAIASMGETGLLLDRANKPLTEAIAWYDQRTVPQLEQLDHYLGREAIFRVTGMPLQPIYSLFKILWLRENRPADWAQAVRWLNSADFIAFRLCGVQATDYSLATRTLALDLYQLRWADDLLSSLDLSPDLFAPLMASGKAMARLTADAARETGLPAHVLVSTGGHDHVCGAMALGIHRTDTLLDSLGTAEAFFVPVERPLGDPIVGQQGYSQGVIVVSDQPVYYVLGGLFTSGGSIEWLCDILYREDSEPDYAALIGEAEQVPPGSLGVCFLPYLRMSSPPFVDDKAKGAFIGLSTDVKRGTLFRAVLEGLACGIRQSMARLWTYPGVAPQRQFYAIGGGTRNPLLMQIKATVSNQPILIADVVESTALGAALMGGLGAGVYPDLTTALSIINIRQQLVEPILEQVPFYQALYEDIFCQLYPTLLKLHHQIYDLQAGPLSPLKPGG